MKTMTYSESRAKYAETLNAVVDDREEVIITRAGHEPVVIVALDDYESLKETAYLLKSPENARRLLASIDRLEHDCDEVNASLGLAQMPEGDPDKRGAGDIALVSFMPGLLGLGMGGEGAHAPGETADLKTMDVQAERAALLMARLAKEPRPH